MHGVCHIRLTSIPWTYSAPSFRCLSRVAICWKSIWRVLDALWWIFRKRGGEGGIPVTRVTTITSTDTMLLIFFGLSLNPAVPSCWWSSPSPVGCKKCPGWNTTYSGQDDHKIQSRGGNSSPMRPLSNYCNVLILPSPWTDFERLLETNTDTAT